MKYIYIITFLILGIFTSCQDNSTSDNSDVTTNTIAEKTKITYQLKGFNSSCCVGIVNYSLEDNEGVIMIKPNTNKQEITIWYDGQKTNDNELQNAINQTPYKVLSTKETLKM